MRKLIIVIIFLYLTGCSNNERSIVEPRFTTLAFKTFSADALQLKVLTDETIVTDSLFAPDGKKSISVEYYDPAHRIRLVDVLSGRVWLDTMINYKSGFTNSITFYQPSAGANFVWVGPPANELLPPADYAKVSVQYTHAALPDSLKVVVVNPVEPKLEYKDTDSFILKKNAFSRYFLAYNKTTKKVKLELYSTDGKRKKMAYAEVTNFADLVSGEFNIYLFRKSGVGTGDSLRILGEKLY
jgi:hypothetical protein